MYVKSLLVLLSFVTTLSAVSTEKSSGVGMSGISIFYTYDMNGNGFLDKAEFDHMRKTRQAERAKKGRMLRNAATAATFEEIDTNGDKKISKSEFSTHHKKRQQANQQ